MDHKYTVVTTWKGDNEEAQANLSAQHPKSKSKTWRRGALACAVASSLVFLLNLAITVYIGTSQKHDETAGRRTLYTGDCKLTARLNTGIHVIINALSTILLSSSNYCMQCISAPTRDEIDRAHKKKKWLDVGTLSVRNLRFISGRRVFLWWMLGISSFPLHLFYNSAVFASIGSHRYWPILVTRPFVEQAQISGYDLYDTAHLLNTSLTVEDYDYKKYEAIRMRNLYLQGRLERLTLADCIEAYARQFQTRGSVLLVTDNTTVAAVQDLEWTNGLNYMSTDGGCDWMCYNNPTLTQYIPCDLTEELASYRTNASSWRPGNSKSPIAYCLSEQLPDVCKVQSSLEILIIVVILNAAKALSMLYIALAIKVNPILTIGDAVASFLKISDPSTGKMCLVTKEGIKRQASTTGAWVKGPIAYVMGHRRLFASARRLRWVLCMVLYIAILGVAAGFLGHALQTLTYVYPASLPLIMSLGIGNPKTLTMIGLPVPAFGIAGLISNVVIANAAQPVLTVVYFTYNSLFTSMSHAQEWASYAYKRKGLRLSSSPQGHQRSTYFLQLPYRLAIPLMLLSALVHWLASQSIFIAAIEAFEINTRTGEWEKSQTGYSGDGGDIQCGYSPLALLLMTILWLGMIIVLLVAGSRKLVSTMPLVGSCSAAIAAACHVSAKEEGITTAVEKVQWGVTRELPGLRVPGHCAFSKEAVGTPVPGEWYIKTKLFIAHFGCMAYATKQWTACMS